MELPGRAERGEKILVKENGFLGPMVTVSDEGGR